ncbi:ABC transporter [Entamoeba marina]
MEGTKARRVTFTSQSYALLMKNITLLFRNKCTLFCQFLPIIIAILSGVVVIISSVDRSSVQNNYIIYNLPEDACEDTAINQIDPPEAWYGGSYIGEFYSNDTCSGEGNISYIPRIIDETCKPYYKYQGEDQDELLTTIKTLQTDFENHPLSGTNNLPQNVVLLDDIGFIDSVKKFSLKVYYSIYIYNEDRLAECATYAMQWMSNVLINSESSPKKNLVRGSSATPPAEIYDTMFDTFIFHIFTPLVFTLSMPQWLSISVEDKSNRVREMMKMLGMKMVPYWVIHIVYFFCLYVIQFLSFYIVSLMFTTTYALHVSPLLMFGIYLGYGLFIVSLIPLLTSFFNDSAIASTISTVVLAIVIIICMSLETSNSDYYLLYCLIPFAAFVQGNERIFNDLSMYKTVTMKTRYIPVLLSLYIWSFIVLVIGLYLDTVMPRKYGTPEHPLFFLKWFKRGKDKLIENETLKSPSDDQNVKEEYEKFAHSNYDEDSPLLINGLTKVFKQNGNKQIAVNSLCLEVKNETFGLLGQNGAGKTTTISMLTGLIESNGGSATVCGYDINKSMSYIHSVVGVCPQFDVLWSDLTTYETVLFYCRLKGFFRHAKSVAKKILFEVGLWSKKSPKPQSRKTNQLSGGMRRRLSIAIAMTGDPKVVFLDEPTTGLDVAIRRDIWDLILKIQQDRCIILTTHSMEEADVLCDRVGIMSDGDLIALGTCQRIRNIYAPGYFLNVASEKYEMVRKFIHQLLGDDVEINVSRGVNSAMIPMGRRALNSIYSAVLKYKKELGVIDWEIQQKGLEDAFIEIITSNRRKRLEMS